ncbi:MAG: hypothetical protein ACM3WV_11525 [Bacillota bacterium]
MKKLWLFTVFVLLILMIRLSLYFVKNMNSPAAQAGMAMIAVNNSRLPDAAKIIAYFKTKWPMDQQPSRVTVRSSQITFSLGDKLCGIYYLPAPIHRHQLAEPCRYAWRWPAAMKDMERHRAHITVGVMGGENGDPVAASIVLTELVSAVLANTDAVGVYWGAGPAVSSARFFREKTRGMDGAHLPLELWIGFRAGRTKNGLSYVCTKGMVSYGKKEIEMRSPVEKPKALQQAALEAAHCFFTGAPGSEADAMKMLPVPHSRIYIGPSLYNKAQKVIVIE